MREEDPRLREDDERNCEDDERNCEDDERNRGDDNQQDSRTRRLQAGGGFPHQVNQLFLPGIIFANSYLRGLNFISFRVWNFEFCGIFWRRRGWGMSRARRIIFA